MELDEAATILATADFFEVCTAEQRRMLAFASERRLYPRGGVLTRSGEVAEGAHVLISGILRAAPEGSAKPYLIEQPGATIGSMALIVAKTREITVTAEKSSETLFVPRSAFLKLVRQSPDLAQRTMARIRKDLADYVLAIERLKGRIG